MSRSPPIAAPIPIPAFAPVERPVLEYGADVSDAEAVLLLLVVLLVVPLVVPLLEPEDVRVWEFVPDVGVDEVNWLADEETEELVVVELLREGVELLALVVTAGAVKLFISK